MKKNKILFRNQKEADREIENASQYTAYFQPFIDALLSNEFEVEPGIEEIRALILSKNLDDYLKREAVKKTPSINSMFIPPDKKLELIDYRASFSNYTDLVFLFNKIPKQEFTRSKINEYILDDKGRLTLDALTIEGMTNRWTVYADTDLEAEIFEKSAELLAMAEKHCQETGFNIFCYGMINRKEINSGWTINAGIFKQEIKKKLQSRSK